MAVTIRPRHGRRHRGVRRDEERRVALGVRGRSCPTSTSPRSPSTEQAAVWRVAFAAPERDGSVLVALDEADAASSGWRRGGLPRRRRGRGDRRDRHALRRARPDRHRLGPAAHARPLGGLAGAGFARATLWVLEANARGRGFYQHMGWRPTGLAATHMAECANHPMVRYASTSSRAASPGSRAPRPSGPRGLSPAYSSIPLVSSENSIHPVSVAPFQTQPDSAETLSACRSSRGAGRLRAGAAASPRPRRAAPSAARRATAGGPRSRAAARCPIAVWRFA